MIRNPKDYQRQAEQERWEALRRMTVDESIAIEKMANETTAAAQVERPNGVNG